MCACVCVCVSDLSYWSSPSKFTCVYYRSGYWYFYCKHLTMIFILGSLQVTILGTFCFQWRNPTEAVLFSDYSSPIICKITHSVLIWYQLTPNFSPPYSRRHSTALPPVTIKSSPKEKGRQRKGRKKTEVCISKGSCTNAASVFLPQAFTKCLLCKSKCSTRWGHRKLTIALALESSLQLSLFPF